MMASGDVHFDINVVSCDHLLTTDGANLDFDIDDAERLCADVDLYKSWIDGLVELAEPRNQAY